MTLLYYIILNTYQNNLQHDVYHKENTIFALYNHVRHKMQYARRDTHHYKH